MENKCYLSRAKLRGTPGGIFLQFLEMYTELSRNLLMLPLRTIASSLPIVSLTENDIVSVS